MTPRRIILTIALVAAVAVVAGCGGSSSSSSSTPKHAAAATGPTPGYGHQAYKVLFNVENGRKAWVDAKGQTAYRAALTQLLNRATVGLSTLQKLKPPASAKTFHAQAVASLQKLVSGLKAQLAKPKIATGPAGDVVNLIETDIGPEVAQALSL